MDTLHNFHRNSNLSTHHRRRRMTSLYSSLDPVRYPITIHLHSQCPGFQYSSMEQYLMEAKALYFDDQDTAAEIMIRQDPVHQKRRGKSVKNFDLSTWQDAVSSHFRESLMAKFSQVDHCEDFLLSTEGKTLGEANANDSFFGIGIGSSASGCMEYGFMGKNLLGQMLMKVRDSLS